MSQVTWTDESGVTWTDESGNRYSGEALCWTPATVAAGQVTWYHLSPDTQEYREEELRGQELLKELKPEWAEEYQRNDTITVQSKIFPIDYLVYHNAIYTGRHGKDRSGKICIGINQDMPYADKVLSLGLFLEHDEVDVLREGNWVAGCDWGTSAWKVLCRKYPLRATIYRLKRWIKYHKLHLGQSALPPRTAGTQ